MEAPNSSQKSLPNLQEVGHQARPPSPHHHESNGFAEAMVKSMKRIVQKVAPNGKINSPSFFNAMLEYCNTPKKDNVSPAQRLIGQPTRTRLPCGPAAFRPDLCQTLREADQRATELRAIVKLRYDAGAHALKGLASGDIVRVQHSQSKLWDTLGEVIKKFPNRQSYLIKTETGRLKWRNRRFLRQILSSTSQGDDPKPTEKRPESRRGTRNRRVPQRFSVNP